MTYLYHMVPSPMQGHILYPLNQLKNKFPDEYKRQVEKYVGREQLLKRRIPIPGCLWNDVLHFTAVEPLRIKTALASAGFRPPTWSFYQVDPFALDSSRAIVYLYKYESREKQWLEDNFIAYNPSKISKYNILPQRTIDYYQEEFTKHKRPLLYHLTQHILYRGSLDISEANVIKV